MKRTLFATAICRGLPIRYYLLLQKKAAGYSYGIRVEYNGESVTAAGLSLSEMKIRQLLGTLVRGCVTPVSVPDILQDWLLE
ncbi:MAG: hypothetical protein E7443_00175 [Ruminococcaceae bacterium]|nr:hypothetical protein [Oscillospiraceae bacterium]